MPPAATTQQLEIFPMTAAEVKDKIGQLLDTPEEAAALLEVALPVP